MKTRRTIRMILAVVMVVAVLSAAAFAASPSPEIWKAGTGHFYPYYCTGNGVNVRSGPSTSYVSFGHLNNNETFWHQMDADTGSFSFGKTGDDTAISIAYNEAVWGWVSGQYLCWRDMI